MPKASLQKQFGRRVLSLRTERGWTQDDLCELSGIGREYLSRIENGHREICLNRIAALAKAFKMPISEMLRDIAI